MKPVTPKMTAGTKMAVLQSPIGLRSIVASLAAFFIVVSSVSLLFERGQETQVQMAVEHRNQEMQLKHHDQQLRGQEAEVQLKVTATEHHDQQLRANETEVQVKVVAAAVHHGQQLRGDEAEVQVKVVAAAEHHDQQLTRSEAEVQVKMAAAKHHDQQLRENEAEAEAEAEAEEVQWRAELQDSGEECNWSTGRWVYDNASRPLYSGLNCSFIFPEVACDKYGRKDVMYQHWRWQPHGCDLPGFNATKLLEKLRNKRLVFVGDSLNRNQWVSLVCMVEASIPDDSLKMRIFNGSLISFKALEYNATIDFYWSPLLLESNSDNPIIHRVEYRIIRGDRIEKHASVWRDADIIVFNSYLWCRKQKEDMMMKVMYGSFEDGDARLDEVDMIDGFEIAVKKLTEWLGENIDENKTRIFFAGSSPTHSWASNWGGIDSNKCLNETEPIYKIGYKAATTDYSLMAKAKSYFATLEKKGIHVQILNITELSDYRKDGHPSVYRKQYVPLTKEQIANPASYADCTHWCLPGVPDVWNEFLYGYLMYK